MEYEEIPEGTFVQPASSTSAHARRSSMASSTGGGESGYGLRSSVSEATHPEGRILQVVLDERVSNPCQEM